MICPRPPVPLPNHAHALARLLKFTSLHISFVHPQLPLQGKRIHLSQFATATQRSQCMLRSFKNDAIRHVLVPSDPVKKLVKLTHPKRGCTQHLQPPGLWCPSKTGCRTTAQCLRFIHLSAGNAMDLFGLEGNRETNQPINCYKL